MCAREGRGQGSTGFGSKGIVFFVAPFFVALRVDQNVARREPPIPSGRGGNPLCNFPSTSASREVPCTWRGAGHREHVSTTPFDSALPLSRTSCADSGSQQRESTERQTLAGCLLFADAPVNLQQRLHRPPECPHPRPGYRLQQNKCAGCGWGLWQ